MNNLSPRELLSLLYRNIIIIIISAIVGATGAYVYSKNFTEEKYMSHGSVLVNNGGIISNEVDGDRVNNTDIAASINLMSTIKDLLVTPGIYQQVAEAIDYKYTAGQLMNAVKITSTSAESLIIKISFELNTKKDATEVTDKFLNLVPDYISSHITGSHAIITAPATNARQTAPQTVSTTIAGGLFGAVICFAIIFVIFLLNATIKSDEDFSMRYDIPVLGNIPDFSASGRSRNNNASKSKAKARR